MKIIISIILALVFSGTIAYSQEQTLKEKALEEFKKEHYNEAISLLEKAVIKSPNDAEIYYYFGWFNHYRAYDSRPLSGYDYSYSEQIFKHLDKALELNPNYGDAKYFYGAECSGNAFISMQNYDANKLEYFYRLAYKKGAYPKWLIEFGRNLLSQCDTDAILFTGGNMDFDICSYLQLCENFRTDVTIIPIGNIDRPWYVRFLKKGMRNVRKINLNLTDQQIMDIHPFKWRETDVFIDISGADKIKYDLNENYKMKWTVYPDLTSERMHSKIESEQAQKRKFLSPQRAMLLQIVEDNFTERPVFFSNFATPTYYGGLDEYFQNCGLVSRLTPLKTKGTEFASDVSKLEKLITTESLENYKTIKDNDLPRISGIAIYGYFSSIVRLVGIYRESNKSLELEQLIKLFENHLHIDFDPDYEQRVMTELRK